MNWDISPEQIIEGEMDLGLTEFTNRFYEKITDFAAMSMEEVSGGDPVIDQSLDPLEDYKIQFFICYYNFALCMATDRTRRQFVSFTKKLKISESIRKKFIDKKYLIDVEKDAADTIVIFRAVLKRFVSELMESGTTTTRLPQMLYMQQLNSFSSIIPNVMKNEKARNMLLNIEFGSGFFGGKFKKLLGG
jgi:hypothetical protein